jgi:hypothetical protein
VWQRSIKEEREIQTKDGADDGFVADDGVDTSDSDKEDKEEYFGVEDHFATY